MMLMMRYLAGLIILTSVINIVMTSTFSERSRPRVVTAIGKLRILAGVLVTGFGLYIATSASGYLEYMGESLADYASQEELDFFSSFIGGILVIQGVAGIVIAIGILGGKRWAWTANVVFSSILILLAASDIAFGELRSIVGLIFNAFILLYMFTKPVKLYFGRISLPFIPPSPSPPAGTPLA